MATTLAAIDPRTGEELPGVEASSVDEARAAIAAAAEVATLGVLEDPVRRADLLRRAAAGLRRRGDELAAVFLAESGLPAARSTGELERTAGQLEAFATGVERGELLDVVIDRADAAATPPRPDLRRTLVALRGPVAVFGASNFPFAFGVAGGDTASALAAGCPVVVKGHPSQPGVNALVAEVLHEAVAAAGLPRAAFAAVQGAAPELGLALVDAPATTAVAFTGSLEAGRALFDRAAARPVPIPVFAEMGSVNPVVVTQRAAAVRADALAELVAASVSGAAGQLCTKPGVLLVPAGAAGDALAAALAARLAATPSAPMLNTRLRDGFARAAAGLLGRSDVRTLAAPGDDDDDGEPGVPAIGHAPVLLEADAAAFAADPVLREELFGPAALVVRYADSADLLAALDALGGQLTATLHAEPDDADDGALVAITRRLAAMAGRVLFGGVPTGVAVARAMTHGGPYPATTAPATTSVGMAAAARFLRPVTYQDAPASVLPDALRDGNPLGLWRRVDGELTRDAL